MLLCPLTLLNYLPVILFHLFASSSLSPSSTFLAGGKEQLSVVKPNSRSQIHNMPGALYPTQGEELLIFQRTLHYHSGQNTPAPTLKNQAFTHTKKKKIHIYALITAESL